MPSEEGNHASEPVGEIVRIFRRGQVWWLNYQHGSRQHRRSLRTTNKKEARRRALRLEVEILAGKAQRQSQPPSVDAAIDAYLSYQRTERRAPKTLAKYEATLKRLTGLLRSRRANTILNLDVAAVDAYRHARVAAGISPKTLYTETVVIRQLVNFALSRGMIHEDPLRGLKIREPKPTAQPCWTASEVERILAASPATHRVAFTLLADTGMRVSELCHLTHEDVDFERNVLHIRPKEGWRTKTGDQRAIPMCLRVRTLLLTLPRHGQWVLTAPPSSRYPRGDHQVSERRLLAVLKRVLSSLGLPGHLHTFRHAFISRALSAGTPEAIVREWVGHVDRDVIRLYTHIASATSQTAMNQLSAVAHGAAVASPSGGRLAGAEPDLGSARFQHKITEAPNDERAK